MMELLSFFGLGGVAGLLVVTFLLPKLLPSAVVNAVISVLEAAARAISWLLTNLASGSQHIAQSNAAVVTLSTVALLFAVLGHVYSPEPADRSTARREETSRVETVTRKAAAPKRAPAACSPLDIFCRMEDFTR